MSVFFFLLGAVVASFICCMTDRRLTSESPWGRSHCPHCGHQLSAGELIPVFSYILLKGRCRTCHQRIDGWLPAFELTSGMLFSALYQRYGISLLLVRYLVFFTLLMTISYSDLKSFRVPDSLSAAALLNRLMLYQSSDRPTKILIEALYVPAFLLLFSLLFALIRRKQPLGLGDIKLFFVLGCYFDWEMTLLILFLSCLIGTCYCLLFRKKDRDRPFPFVPCIYAASVLTLFWGRTVITFYLFRIAHLLQAVDFLFR
ncbi:MAG: prepilin peptidase [Erysipelotrichaceae bacterium]|nr:prepilin peptidase [Erysipelotrichaceae bacterium]MBO4537939.1 prepilin peptidase [Erysipelotrichaceae bacterium]